MEKQTNKYIIGALLILPLLVLLFYTFLSGRDGKHRNINIDKMNLSSPQDLPNEIASYLEENDFETALLRIEADLRDPDVRTSKGVPLIVIAAEKNNYDIVALLASMGADVNLREERTNETAIIKAARNNNTDMIRLLLAAGGNINAQNRRGVSALKESIDKKNKPLMEFLTENGARTGVSFDNLMLYASQKNDVGVSAMLRAGISPRQSDSKGNTPLIVSASRGDLPSIEELLAYESDTNARNKQGMTPLLYAVRSGNQKIIEKLLSVDETDVNLSDIAGQSPLFWAAYRGDDKTVNVLLTLGADYNKKTKKNQTALDIAKLNNRTKTAKIIEDFIKYKNLPKDKNGKVIINKNSIEQEVQSKTDNKGSAQTGSNKQAAMVDAMSGTVNMDSVAKMMQEQQNEAIKNAQQQMQQQMPQNQAEQPQEEENSSVRSKFTPKRTSSKSGKTKVNTLQSRSN